MKSLFFWPLRNLGRRKTRTVLTLFGVALGVAAMVGVSVLRETAIRSVSDLFDQAAGRADLAVTNAVAGIVGGEGFDAAALEQIYAVEGVELAAPLLQVTTLPVSQLDDWEFSFAFGNFRGAVLYGIDPAASRELGHYRLVEGSDLAMDDQDAILLPAAYADELGLKLGDQLELVAPVGTTSFTIRGLLATEGLVQLNRGQAMVTSLSAAQDRFERAHRLDQVDVVAKEFASQELKARLETVLGSDFRVFRPGSKGELVDQMLQTVIVGMGFVGVMSLAVGGFLIYNTFAMTVLERTHELGLLRALGTSRRQIVALMLFEASILGFFGASLGVLLGIGMAAGLRGMAEATITNELIGLAILPEQVLFALFLGILISLLAALVPALTAGRLPVVESIQQRQAHDGQISKSQLIAGLCLTVPSLILTIVNFASPVEIPYQVAYLTCMTLGLGVGLLIAILIPVLEKLTTRLFSPLGVAGKLGARNLARSPGRSALTAGALMFGLASVITIWAVIASLQNTADEYIESSLGADLWLYGPHTLSAALPAEIETLPDVQVVGGGASLPTRLVPSDPTEPELAMVFTAFDVRRLAETSMLFAPNGGTHQQAKARLAQGGAVLIASPLREWYGYDVGDTIRLQTLQGPIDFEVAGVTLDLSAIGFSVQGVWPDAARYFGTDRPEILAVDLRPGSDPAVVGQQIMETWGEKHNLKMETQAEFRARTQQQSDQMTSLYDTLVLVGVVTAALGVTNTLLMNVLERRREIGVLRSLGMTRGQIIRLILAEAAALGGLGGALGIGIGSWISYYAVSNSAAAVGYDFPYVLPVEAILISVGIALFVPLMAGLWPAWYGARSNVVQAIRSE